MTNDIAASDPVPPDVRARLAAVTYLILPPSLGHTRRAAIAHHNVSQALGPGLTDHPDQPLGAEELARLRVRVVRLALGVGNRSRLPMPSMASRTGDAGARDKALGGVIPAARAAHALRRVEGVSREETVGVLAGAGVSDPETAVRVSERLSTEIPVLAAADVPTLAWLRRRRHRVAGAFATACVVLVGGALTATIPGSGDDQVPASSTSGVGSGTIGQAAEAAARAVKPAAKRAKAKQAATSTAAKVASAPATSTDRTAAERQVAEQAAATRAAQARAARAARAADAAKAAEAAQAAAAAEAARRAEAARVARADAARIAAAEAARKQAAQKQAAEKEAAQRLRDPSLPEAPDPAPAESAAAEPAASDPAVLEPVAPDAGAPGPTGDGFRALV